MSGLGEGTRRRVRRLVVATSVILMALVAGTAAVASATVRVQVHSDPAGDATEFGYRVEPPAPMAPIEFGLRDGGEKDSGPFEGTVTVRALPAAGWAVSDIQCVGPDPADFTIDIPHGTVTLQHRRIDDQTCAFTHRRLATPGEIEPPATHGIAPSPPLSESGRIVVPRRPLLLNVRAERGFAVVRVRLPRYAVLKAQLLWRGRLLASARVVRPAGIYEVTPRLNRATRRMLRHRGLWRVTLTLRVVVAERSGRTYVLGYRVRLRVS
ncbi:MAG TPA: hypothetical protein VNT03_00245 [Baekduia sp.]|nr:hypothetical protein [Baekduia sp.]